MPESPSYKPTRVSVTFSTAEHLGALDRAMFNTTSTDLAFETLAQIVDGTSDPKCLPGLSWIIPRLV